MAISVNPPPQVPIPRKLLDDEELRDFFIFKQEFEFKLWLKAGGEVDLIEGGNNNSLTTAARVTTLEQRLGSGNPLTSDEIGFTVDSIEFTVDMVEA